MFSSIIISGALAQDHEFIYPFYRLLEEKSKLDVCLIGGKPVQGILGTTLPPIKDYPVKDIMDIKVKDYRWNCYFSDLSYKLLIVILGLLKSLFLT